MKKSMTSTPKPYRHIIVFATVILLMLSLGMVAYATDFFDLRALLMTDGHPASGANAGSSYISLTQPQDVPEEISLEIRNKIDNSKTAWEEWSKWKSERFPVNPYESIEPDDAISCDAKDNGDGTYTLIYYLEDNKLEKHVVSAESWYSFIDFVHLMGQGGIAGYDHKYGVYSREMAEKLEEIASKYGLSVRHNCTQLFQNLNGYKEGLTFDEITARINDICGNGHFFNSLPTGYEKFYYFDEGTFAVSFFTTDNLSNTGTNCYLYNSPYDTLSSGFEIFYIVQDIDSFSTRYHTTPDGTNLTVLQNGSDMYAYVYLENSFVTIHIMQIDRLSDAEIDAILDMVDFSSIA